MMLIRCIPDAQGAPVGYAEATSNRQMSTSTPNPPFQLPHNGLTYTEEVVERCRDLIDGGIWAGVHPIRLSRWLNNYQSDEERYFSACILDNLIYRSEQQTVSLTRQLLQRTLVDQARADAPPLGRVTDWLGLLRSPAGRDPGVRLVVVVQRDDPPTKSAYVIARLMKRYLRINENWIITPWVSRNPLFEE